MEVYRHGIEKDWRDKIQRGDILASPSGLRVVRRVKYTKDGFIYGIVLSILRCSWTRRPYTTVTRSDLGNRGFLPTGAKASLRATIDQQLDREIGANEKSRRLYCWDVVGIIS